MILGIVMVPLSEFYLDGDLLTSERSAADRSALTLLVARIARADDTDDSVAFDDLAEFTSALHRSSYFHVPFSLCEVVYLQVRTNT